MNDKKEAIWFGVVAGIAMLVLVILHQSSGFIGAQAGTEEASIPGVYWVLVVTCLSLCALVSYLLKNSSPLDFKIIAVLLTGVAPAVLIGFVLFSVWRSTGAG